MTGQADCPKMTSSSHLGRHEILRGNLPLRHRMDALHHSPTGPHRPAAPFGDSDGMNTDAKRKVRTGHFLRGKEIGELHDA